MNNTTHLFTTQEERYKRVNRFFLLAADLLFLIFLFYQTIQVVKPDKEEITTSWNLILLMIFCILNIIIYCKNPYSSRLKNFIVIEVAIEFTILSIHPTATFLGIALSGVLCVLIPYYEDKFYNRTLAAYALIYTASLIFRIGTKIDSFTASSLCGILITYAFFIVLVRTGSITKMFSDHMLSYSKSQSDHLAQLLQEVLEISRTIKNESDSSTKTMNYLLHSAIDTASHMEDISTSTNVTAENIEEQTGMTQSIQNDITETKNCSQKMVSIATTSNEKIVENQQMMEELKEQSIQVKETNRQVTEAMAKLQENTKEVETIAGIILNISGQTNLLALNASIESARAGEAGRGFAIVAEQIRQLSAETRKATESISNILNELNYNANEVVSVINGSVTAAENQNTMIHSAAKTFEQLQENMTELITDIQEMDEKINHLSNSNNTIVENITMLSAGTQEITAIANQTNDLSKLNLEYTEQVKKAIALIQENALRLDKYTLQSE